MHGRGVMRWPREKTSSGDDGDDDSGEGGMSDHWKALGSSGGVPGIIMRMAAAKGPQYDGAYRHETSGSVCCEQTRMAEAVTPTSSTGEWYEDKRHGHGVMEWPDGRRYDGEWVADTMVDPSLIEIPQDGSGDALQDGGGDAPHVKGDLR